MSDPDPN